MTGWYHGGAPGLEVGDALLPSVQTGVDPRNENEDRPFASWAWISHESEHAAFYAAMYPNRARTISEVEPIDLQPEGVLRWERSARSARVIRIIGQPHFAPEDAWFSIANPTMRKARQLHHL